MDEIIESTIIAVAETKPYRENVARLRCFKGIDYVTALAFVCEIGDYRRFRSAAAFMSYLGLVPSEYSSGTKRRQDSGAMRRGKAMIKGYARHNCKANSGLILFSRLINHRKHPLLFDPLSEG